jgi:glycosyltransferase involved in cell wall biosynthesis
MRVHLEIVCRTRSAVLRISVITTSFNSGATIRDTVESVLLQSYKNVEHIIVDGGSKDGTLGIIGEYQGRIARVISEPDEGLYDAMNKGIRAATGEIIGILNSDDFFEARDVLADVADAFAASPDTDIVFGDVVFVRPGDLDAVVRHYSSRRFRRWKLRFGWMPPHPATFVRSGVYDRCGGYCLDYKIAADYEMFVRWLLRYRLNFRRMDRVIVRMRTGGASTAGLRSSLVLNSEIVRACRENGVYTNLALVLSKLPFKLLELKRRAPTNRPFTRR